MKHVVMTFTTSLPQSATPTFAQLHCIHQYSPPSPTAPSLPSPINWSYSLCPTPPLLISYPFINNYSLSPWSSLMHPSIFLSRRLSLMYSSIFLFPFGHLSCIHQYSFFPSVISHVFINIPFSPQSSLMYSSIFHFPFGPLSGIHQYSFSRRLSLMHSSIFRFPLSHLSYIHQYSIFHSVLSHAFINIISSPRSSLMHSSILLFLRSSLMQSSIFIFSAVISHAFMKNKFPLGYLSCIHQYSFSPRSSPMH